MKIQHKKALAHKKDLD